MSDITVAPEMSEVLEYERVVDGLREENNRRQAETGPCEFRIDSETAANWLLRKLGNLEAEKARVKAQAAELCAQIDSDIENLKFLYGAQLETWARTEIAKGRRRSVTLLQGTLALRTVPAGIRVADEASALAAAQQMGVNYYRVSLSPEYSKAAEKALTERGELLPGMERTQAHESFSIRFPKATK